jgi:Cdc6-like AAA superfamily ATPase
MILIGANITKRADFAHRLDKEHQLSALEVDPQSFDWIWSSTFEAWLKSNDSLFWIAGKPASGKSTLVNYVSKHQQTRKLAATSTGRPVKIAKFFFDFRGKDGITNNFEGLRRSLLHQMLQTSTVLATEVD